MGDSERSSAREAAKQRVLALIEEHPELAQKVDLGDLVSNYRKHAPESSVKFWETDWDAILEVLKGQLPQASERP